MFKTLPGVGNWGKAGRNGGKDGRAWVSKGGCCCQYEGCQAIMFFPFAGAIQSGSGSPSAIL